jgi:hypothetical protein
MQLIILMKQRTTSIQLIICHAYEFCMMIVGTNDCCWSVVLLTMLSKDPALIILIIASENDASALLTANRNAIIAANNFSNGFVPPSKNILDSKNTDNNIMMV